MKKYLFFLGLFFFLIPFKTFAVVNIVQNISVSTSSVGLLSNVNIGDTLLVACESLSNPAPLASVTDTLGNTFQFDGGSPFNNNPPYIGTAIASVVATAGGADTVSCNWSGSPLQDYMYVYELSGLQSSGGYPITDASSSYSSNPTSVGYFNGSAITTMYANDFVFGTGMNQDTGTCTGNDSTFTYDLSLCSGATRANAAWYDLTTSTINFDPTVNFTGNGEFQGMNVAFECSGLCGSGGGGGGGSTGNLTILYPVNGSSTSPFSDWILHTGGFGSSTGQLDIIYGISTSTFFFQSSQIFNGSVSLQGIPFLQYPPFNLGSSSEILYAKAFLDSGTGYFSPTGTYFGGIVLTSSSLISFTLNNSSTYIYTTPTISFLSSSVSTSSVLCSSGNFIADGLCVFAVGALTPQANAQGYLGDSVASFETAPPFSGMFYTLGSLNSSLSSTPVNQELDVPVNFGSHGSGTIAFLTSSTLSQAATPAGKVILFNVEDAVFELLDLSLIFWVPWHWWRKKHNNSAK